MRRRICGASAWHLGTGAGLPEPPGGYGGGMGWLGVLPVITAAIGAVLVGYGGWILATGRASRRTARAFASTGAAGRYTLSMGGALLLLTAGNLGVAYDRPVHAMVAAVAAVALVLLAVIRYRPRPAGRR
jgi:hypothetical protein